MTSYIMDAVMEAEEYLVKKFTIKSVTIYRTQASTCWESALTRDGANKADFYGSLLFHDENSSRPEEVEKFGAEEREMRRFMIELCGNYLMFPSLS